MQIGERAALQLEDGSAFCGGIAHLAIGYVQAFLQRWHEPRHQLGWLGHPRGAAQRSDLGRNLEVGHIHADLNGVACIAVGPAQEMVLGAGSQQQTYRQFGEEGGENIQFQCQCHKQG